MVAVPECFLTNYHLCRLSITSAQQAQRQSAVDSQVDSVRQSSSRTRHADTPLVQECARSGSRVQVRTGNPLLPKGRERCGNCCVAASCTVIRLNRSPSKQTASCVTR